MQRTFERWLDRGLNRSPVQPLFMRKAEDRLTVLAYHGVEDAECFARQLDHLTRMMHPVGLDEVLTAFDGGRAIPKRAALVTFDDGDRSVLEVAMPLLRERGVPAVAFVVAGLIDTEQPPWWIEVEQLIVNGGHAIEVAGMDPRAAVQALKTVPDIRRLAVIAELRRTARKPVPRVRQLTSNDLLTLEAAGIAIGNHTLTHPCLNLCTDDKVLQELSDAHRRLEVVLGKHPRAFAYPNGNSDRRVENVLARLGYKAGFLFDHKVSAAQPANRLAISRVRVNSYTCLDRFDIIVSGLHPALLQVRDWL